jgi:hypothetical protein
MALGDFVDDTTAWLDDLSKPKPKQGDVVLVAPPVDVAAPLPVNPKTGYSQIYVSDPDHPGLGIWVDALWNPIIDSMVPIDRKYRSPSDSPALYRVGSPSIPLFSQFDGSGNAINFSGPLNLSTASLTSGALPSVVATTPQTGSSGGGWLIAAAFVLLVAWALSE